MGYRSQFQIKLSSQKYYLFPFWVLTRILIELYGGGFYDRYIKKIKKKYKIITIGLAYSFQKIKSVPVKSYDAKLDFIITN